MGNFTVSSSRKIKVAGPLFNAEAWKKQIYEAIESGVRNTARKAQASAIEDAPVRDVFKHGSSYRRRGLKTRGLSRNEAFSEIPIRQRLLYRNKDGDMVPLAPAVPGQTRTRGRSSGVDPFLRGAANRKGNPNAFAPTMLSPAHMDEEGVRVPARYGGRETSVVGGKRVMTHHPDALDTSGKSPLHARGRYELKTGRGLSQGAKQGEVTLGGTLRRSIKMLGPHRIGGVIKAKVVSPVPYSMFQEFGTRHNRATPYMRPAILKSITTYRREMVKAINRAGRG
jgi:HK97 gp10 family phage protein